jgi:hypothetical protein
MKPRRRPDPWLTTWHAKPVKRQPVAPSPSWPPQFEQLPHHRDEIDAWAHELYRVDGIPLGL